MAVKSINVLIAGGGTGGHISPGVALYEEFRSRGMGAIFLVGKKDERFSSLEDVSAGDLIAYSAPTLTKNIFKLPFFALSFLLAVIAARRIIRKNEIRAVIGMGGYVSAPALIAARTLGVPLFLCEQNAVPGKVTASFEKHASRVYGTFIGALEYLSFKDKYVNAGNPIRKKVLGKTSIAEARRAFHLEASKKVILAIGGSQGALRINELVHGLKTGFAREFKDVGIIWSTGSYSYDKFKSMVQSDMEGGAIYMSPFIDKVGLAYAACDLAISRSGSGVMMELAAMGIPSIQIPYPFAAMDHQDKNADDFVRAGAAIKISNEDAVPEKVAPVIIGLLGNDRQLNKMKEAALRAAKPDAAAVIVEDIARTVEAACGRE